jgi:hypothetical protein
MRKLRGVADATSANTDSRIGFQTEGNSNWPAWDRFITLDGKKAHYIGNVCGTCPFIFERQEGANDKASCTDLSESLRQGVSSVDEAITRVAAAALPTGIYKAMLLTCVPRLIVPSQKGDYFFEEQIALWGIDPFWGVPHYTKNEYYRVDPANVMSNRGRLFEFIVPMFPKRYLEDKTIQSYKSLLESQSTPTALAISILDVKQPADWHGDAPEVTEHWCLAHYLLDGHHKMYAASQGGKPISLLSFLAVDKGVSSTDQIEEVLAVLARG